jgi:hypothetical protein
MHWKEVLAKSIMVWLQHPCLIHIEQEKITFFRKFHIEYSALLPMLFDNPNAIPDATLAYIFVIFARLWPCHM